MTLNEGSRVSSCEPPTGGNVIPLDRSAAGHVQIQEEGEEAGFRRVDSCECGVACYVQTLQQV